MKPGTARIGFEDLKTLVVCTLGPLLFDTHGLEAWQMALGEYCRGLTEHDRQSLLMEIDALPADEQELRLNLKELGSVVNFEVAPFTASQFLAAARRGCQPHQ